MGVFGYQEVVVSHGNNARVHCWRNRRAMANIYFALDYRISHTRGLIGIDMKYKFELIGFDYDEFSDTYDAIVRIENLINGARVRRHFKLTKSGKLSSRGYSSYKSFFKELTDAIQSEVYVVLSQHQPEFIQNIDVYHRIRRMRMSVRNMREVI